MGASLILGAMTALMVGAAYGYVSQRGAFCMNSGFRFVVTKRDTTKIKAFALAVAVQMVLLPSVFAAAFSQPTYPSLFPVGAVVGGLLFGASMYWAGGCAAGVWYKAGAGSMAGLVAAAGMALGAAAFEVGPMAPVREAVQALGATALPSHLRVPAVAPLIVGVVLLGVLLRAGPGTMGSWSWRRTGLLMGLVGAVAWPASSLFGRDFGLAVVPGTVGLLTAPFNGVSWDVFLVLGVPVGAFVAARRDGPVKVERIAGADAARRFAGGLGLGVGASLAAGCTVGHGLTGVPLLAPGSILAIVSIFAGSTMTAVWQQRRATAAVAAIAGDKR